MVSLRSILVRSPISRNSVQSLTRWRQWMPHLEELGVIAIAGLTVSLGVTTAARLGILEGPELLAYDQMVRIRHQFGELPTDDRILVVTVTEADLDTLQEAPLTDGTVAKALQQLQAHDPAAIGLDMYRASPQGTGREALIQALQADNVISITKLPDANSPGIPAPAEVSPAQVSFNDVVVDPDGAIRRILLMGETATPEGNTVLFSLSLTLALRYLAQHDIHPTANAENPAYMQLGPTPFVPLRRDSGGYAQADAAGYQVMLDYRRSVLPTPQVSLLEVLSGEVDPALVRGKVVLIGITAPSFKDLFYTPFTGAGQSVTHQMPGVVIHAQMVSQILDAATGTRSLLHPTTPPEEAAWMLLWAMLGGALAWRLRHPVNFTLGQVALLLCVAGAAYSLFLQGLWVPIAAPIVATVGTGSVVLAYQAQQSSRQRQMMLTLLGQTASPEIAAALWENRDRLLKSGKLPGQNTVATMLFTDIRGFSSLAEVTPPEELLEWLNEYLEAMTDAIQEHHGIVNKFTGDGLLAAFGVPIARTTPEAIAQDAIAAVRCGLSMSQRLARLNAQRQSRNLPKLEMRVGIFTGKVVVGSLGGHNRMEYGIIGDSVNIASRLESYDKDRQPSACRILIGDETLAHLGNTVAVESWGDLILKGRHAPIGVYRVLEGESTQIQGSLPSM